jgi:hypothetical protein
VTSPRTRSHGLSRPLSGHGSITENAATDSKRATTLPFNAAVLESRPLRARAPSPRAEHRDLAGRSRVRSHFIGRANFDDRPVNSGPQERSSGPLLFLPDSSAALRLRRARRARGQRSRRERTARSRALVSPTRDSVSASNSVHRGERDRERSTARPLRAGRVGDRLTGHSREGADALSVVARDVPAATSFAFFPSGVRHCCGV